MNGFAQVQYATTQQKRNSELVATLIIPAAEADSGKSHIRHNYERNDPAFESPFFPPPPSISLLPASL